MTATPATIQLTLPDGYCSHARLWKPENPRGVVLYLHGIQSHGGWYETSGQALANAGLVVLMPDRRGSGANGPPRGHYDSLDQCLADSRAFLDAATRAAEQPSVHVIGVSWGGKQAVYLAQAFPQRVKSISLIGPGIFPRVDLTIGEKFRVGVSMINDREKLYDIPLNDPLFFTENPERIRFVENDKFLLKQVSASFLLASRRLDKLIRAFPDSPYRGPVHLFLAGKDRIIDNEKTRAWLRGLPSPDRRITEFPEGGHTLEFDADSSRFVRELVTWITERA